MSLATVFPANERVIMNPFNNVDPVLPVQNTRGNTSLANIYNRRRQVEPLVKIINNPEDYAFAKNITKNAKSYTDKGSFEEIFKSMGILDNTIDPESAAFKDGAIKLAYIRLIISGRIQYKQKSEFLNTIIGTKYNLSNSTKLRGPAKRDFRELLKSIANEDVRSFTFDYGQRFHGIMTRAMSIGFLSAAVTLPVMGADLMTGGVFGSIVGISTLIVLIVGIHIANKLVNTQLVIDVLIKLLDAFLISNESLMYALGSERIEQFPLLYDDPNSRAVYYKYVNELSKIYEHTQKIREFTADAGEHPTLSNFVSDNKCGICLDSLAQPYKKVMEVCPNHHRFHMICMKIHMEEYSKTHYESLFHCPLCREVITEDVKNKLKDYTLPNNIKEGGSKKKHRRTSKTRKYRK